MIEVKIGSLWVELHRKPIKNLHISVMPPDGKVRVAAPEIMTDTAIRMAVVHKLAWIRKQQRNFVAQPRQSEREMLTGESHYLWGRRLRLDVELSTPTKAAASCVASGERLLMRVTPAMNTAEKLKLLNSFYREQLHEQLTALVPTWQQVLGLGEIELQWSIRLMRTKWGSCATEQKRILFNLELAKQPLRCLEYIVVHELLHLLERKHNDQFRNLLDQYLPDWTERKHLLAEQPY